MKQGDRIQNGHQYGFFMIPNEMIDSHIENMGALGFVVYSVLMRHANSSSQCFPSYSTLEKKSSLSRPTIAKCIENLVNKGYIQKLDIGNSRGHATTYQLLDLSLVPTSKGDLPVNEVNQSMGLTSKGDLPVTSKGDLPQLVNEVNSNNTHLTKPINNNTHIKEGDFFENLPLEQKKENSSDLSKPEDPKTTPLPPSKNSIQSFEDRMRSGAKSWIWQRKISDRPEWSELLTDWAKSKDCKLGFKNSLIEAQKAFLKKRNLTCDHSAAMNSLSNYIKADDIASFMIRADEAIALEKSIEQSQARSQSQPTPQPIEEPTPIAPVPSNVKDFVANLARKVS